MERSKKGLSGAGEWFILEKMLPDLTGKRVLDLGCGFGWHCRYAVENGAVSAVGLDISELMIGRAREINCQPGVEYMVKPFEEMDFSPASFDIVLSSLALHYTPALEDIYSKVYEYLVPGGTFIFSAEHPVFTAEGSQLWHRDRSGNILHWPVDNYFAEGSREAVFLGEKVVKYHRTLTSYLSGLLKQGFRILEVAEAGPDPELLAAHPGLEDELRRPMMLLVKAEK